MNVHVINDPEATCERCGLRLGPDHEAANAKWSDLLKRLEDAEAFLATSDDTAPLSEAVGEASYLVMAHAMPVCHPEAVA